MNLEKTTTRQQLQGYGATRYQARAVTQALTPVGKQGRAYAYALSDVIVSLRNSLQQSRIKLRTRAVLAVVLKALLERLNNVIEISFSLESDPETAHLAKHLTQAMSNTDLALADLQAIAATINAKYKK